jgi:ferrous iron transport protein B
MMQKEQGWKVSLKIFVLVTSMAFVTGWLLNRFLLFTGLLS